MAEKKVNANKKEKEKEKSSGSGLKIIIIILLTLILLGGAAFAGFFIFFKDNNNTQAVTPNVVNSNNIPTVLLIDENIFDLGEFTVNLSDEGGKRYLKAKISIGYDKKNKNLAKEMEPKKIILRDSVITVLTSKKATDMTQKGKEDLKKELLDKINPLFKDGRITSIYFDDILVQ
ncbi:flagellar basal body-associated FliL family protein [Desnuesiella massiliensis]|uniref:flagellar basal body-associated FliL family protein n=1 Tax=Desnuesiella massiliensis TaxID=1650662 RepID=UPI0006E1C617|nr:flagellar basal body-associated FliL family protein [Desnuesiella massiliensis]